MTTNLLLSEFRKVTTLKFWWALGLAPLLVGLFSGAISLPLISSIAGEVGDDGVKAAVGAIGLLVALALVFVFSALFGAVNAGTEYRHSTITTTFLTARGRDSVVAAKLLVSALFGTLYCLAIELVSVPVLFLVGSDDVRLDGQMAAVLVVGLVASMLWALIGAGLALLTASSIASTVTLVVWYVMGEAIVRAVLAGLHLDSVGQWLPGSVTVSAFIGIVDDSALASGPGTALSLLCLAMWAAVACGLGWWVTRTRDIT
ncbi:ABC transporter permease [Prescottella agglutinans]|uniref:ABC-2 type transport system permease protein n=1 Tax=Prescottella agglutinans TaxID=1644129 RepID=A0ABT6MFF6_9NOCA|nr:ABC transporter permease [Prescottella agglutinans]MDH6282955.1 ABC-2 type transport system permease protein [Prescottella agglutinans]